VPRHSHEEILRYQSRKFTASQ
jgi:serine/threonine protein kinase